MKPALISIILALTGLGVGYLSGRLAAGRFRDEAAVPLGNAKISPRSSGSHSREAKAADENAHDLKSLKQWHRKKLNTGAEIIAQAERLDSEAIRSILTEFASLDPADKAREFHEMKSTLETIAGELFRRDGEQALQWANSVQPAEVRKKVLTAMVSAALAETPALAKPWFDRYLLEFGKNEAFNFGCAATRGATARGAEDLVKLKEIFVNELKGPVPNGPLPEDFDFRMLLENFSAGEPVMREAVQQWAAKSPEAAREMIEKLVSTDELKASLCVGALFAGMAAGGMEIEAARSILPVLDRFSQASRSRALQSLFAECGNARCDVAKIMAVFPREEDRIDIADGMTNSYWEPRWALEALRALGSEDARMKTLVKSAGHVGWNIKSPPDTESRKTLDYYSRLMDELRFSPEAREKVDGQLRPGR